MNWNRSVFIVCILVCLSVLGYGQDPLRFSEEVNELKEKQFQLENNLPVNLFTGSSSIRLWEDLEERFSDKNIINMGFGGSHMSDLLYFSDDLIFKHQFDKVFIYEGDNDIESGKEPSAIILTTDSLIKKIRRKLPEVPIVMLSPKPSISRWHLRNSYRKFNLMLQEYCDSKENITYVDVWTPMLVNRDSLRQDLFIEDDLHMNAKGYDIWQAALKDYLK